MEETWREISVQISQSLVSTTANNYHSYKILEQQNENINLIDVYQICTPNLNSMTALLMSIDVSGFTVTQY